MLSACMTIRLLRALPDRAVPHDRDDTNHALNFQIVPVLKDLVRTLTAAPAEFAWTSGAASVSVSSNSIFVSGALTQNSTLTLVDAFDGAQGTIWVLQDPVGGWTLDIVADGRTVMRHEPDIDSDPDPDPSSLTQYRYTFLTSGVGLLILERIFLL